MPVTPDQNHSRQISCGNRKGAVRISSNIKRALLFVVLLIFLLSIPAQVCYGNSSEPPSILIIVPSAPDDLEISIGENAIANRIEHKEFESFYTFYSYQLKSAEYVVTVTTGGNTFEIKLDTPLKTYNNIYTLDLKNQTLAPGKALSRSVARVSIRVILTLIIEAIVFLIFGYRKKASWLIFLIVNLLTQGILNIWLNGYTPFVSSYLLFSLILGEILVFFVEMIVFLVFIKEHRRWRTALYVIAANILSLIAGAYFMVILPL
jgi:hypothetical protein